VFNNGLGRAYSSVDEFTPPVDSTGAYARVSGSAFGPTDFAWSYVATPPTSMYSEAISGAQRLPNGNTIIDDGTHGTFYEVTSSGQVAWKYICPVVSTGSLTQGDTLPNDPARAGEKMNAVFRVYKYPLDYAAFKGKVLTAGDYVEKYTTGVDESGGERPETFALYQNFPNPFNPMTVVSFQLPVVSTIKLVVYDLLGREVATLVDEVREAGSYEVPFDGARLASGVYIYRMTAGSWNAVKKMVLTK
jgi:hypothetical protein